MHRKILGGFLLVMLATAVDAQVSGIQMFSLPNTATSPQWVKLGTYNASQGGYDVDVKIVSSQGYNASYSQDQVTYIHFKSSNGSSVDGNGFAGDSWWYQTGWNTGAPSQVVWVANASGISATAFTLFAYFGNFTGLDSYYVVDVPSGTTWTNSAAGGQTNPGSGSSTVLNAQNEMLIGSTSSFTGNVGIGTASPGAKLEVDGNVKLTSGSGASLTYADGTVQSTAWTGTLTGGDYAESVNVTGEREQYGPGDVLVVDSEHPGHFLKATESYSQAVAGVYSTKPGVIGRRREMGKDASATEVPMAMVGIVPTKVSTENGPIKPGDVLVTSSIPGYAMKGTDRGLEAGAVIGKALGSLDSGNGVIEAVISLQ